MNSFIGKLLPKGNYKRKMRLRVSDHIKYTVTFYAGKANIKPGVENKHTERNVQSEQPDCQPHNKNLKKN